MSMQRHISDEVRRGDDGTESLIVRILATDRTGAAAVGFAVGGRWLQDHLLTDRDDPFVLEKFCSSRSPERVALEAAAEKVDA